MISPAIPISTPAGDALAFFQIVADEADAERMVCWVYYLLKVTDAGLGPKAWLASARETISKMEAWAEQSGCAEMRIRGRDWSAILLDYEPLEGVPNGLRKRLH